MMDLSINPGIFYSYGGYLSQVICEIYFFPHSPLTTQTTFTSFSSPFALLTSHFPFSSITAHWPSSGLSLGATTNKLPRSLPCSFILSFLTSITRVSEAAKHSKKRVRVDVLSNKQGFNEKSYRGPNRNRTCI